MIVKIHQVDERRVVAVCDDSLVGRKFDGGELQLDLSSAFFKGERMDSGQLEKVLATAYMANFAGAESVGFAVKNGLAKKDNVVTVCGIPNAQVLII